MLSITSVLLMQLIAYIGGEMSAPIVNTLNGPIKGKHYETVFSKQILAFHRIPYIKPPIGSLRFKDPQPVDNWSELLDCSLPPIPSLNKNYDVAAQQTFVEGDESAIHINAYTADLTPSRLRPVMVFIHGGGFVSGSASDVSFSPDFLLERPVVLFTFNYRLGVFGFMSLDDPKLGVPGNAGLKDHTMALRWIKNNCERFGGDPNSITLFGESSGAAAVHVQALSELSRGLFHKAVLMSGTAEASWAIVENKKLGLQLAKSLGWNENDPTEKALEILQNTNGTVLLNAVETLFPPQLNVDNPFLPIIEPYVSEQSLIPKPISEMMLDPWSKEMPFIVSYTSEEGLVYGLYANITSSDLYNSLGDFRSHIPKDLVSNSTECQTKLGLQIKQMYYGDEQPSVGNRQNFINLITDTVFLRSIHTVLQSRTANQCGPTYLLRFAFDSRRFNHFKVSIMQLGSEPGASHADDLSYLFKNDFYESSGGLPRNSKEFKTMQRMVDLYTNFAMTSNPNSPGLDCRATWEPVTSDLPYKCLNIADDLEVIDWPEDNRVVAWNRLYENDFNC